MTSFKRTIAAAAAVALLASSATYAAVDVGPLPAGKPAGTREADLLALGPVFWIGLVAIAVGIGFAVSSNNNGVTTPTTGTGS